jgi:AbrB family looped-hinge helix DNA binding protein
VKELFLLNIQLLNILIQIQLNLSTDMEEKTMTELKKGKYLFGTVKVGERGQIVIPKEARDKFDIKPGDSLMILGDERKGIKIVKAEIMRDYALKILEDTDEAVQDNE